VANLHLGLRELVPECAHYGHIMALYAATRGDFIVIGDLMKSVTLLTYKAIDGSMEEIARDYNPNWMTALEILVRACLPVPLHVKAWLTYKRPLGACVQYLRRMTTPTWVLKTPTTCSQFAATRRRPPTRRGRGWRSLASITWVRSPLSHSLSLTLPALLLLTELFTRARAGDFVNRFRHGSLVMRMPESDAGLVRSTPLLYGTVGGALGVVAAIAEEQFQFFAALQQQLTKVGTPHAPKEVHHHHTTRQSTDELPPPPPSKVVRGVGGFAHDQWRAFSNERKSVPSRGFIDGDLIERFLDLKPAQQAQVAQELAIPADEIARRIETISQALH